MDEEPTGIGLTYQVWTQGKMGTMHYKQYLSVPHPPVTHIDSGKMRCVPHYCGLSVKHPFVLVPYEAPQPR